MKKLLLLAAIVVLACVAIWQIYQVRGRKAGIEELARLREEKGVTAAAIVPADCAFFSSDLLLKERYDLVRNSVAVKRILELPLVQTQLAQISNLPQFQQARELMETNPLAWDSLAVAKDALSNEIFICGDKGWVDVSTALLAWFNDTRMNNFVSGFRERMGADSGSGIGDSETKETIRSFIEHRKNIFSPATLIGFKLSDTEEKLGSVLKQIADSVNKIPELQIKMQPVEINDEQYYTLAFTGEMVSDGALEQLKAKLEGKGCTPQEVADIVDWVRSAKVVITAGYYRPYFILSVGTDNSFLERLGRGEPLLRSPVLAPVERFRDRDVASVDYVSRAMAAVGRFDPRQFQETARAVLEALPSDKRSAAFSERVQEQLARFIKDMEAAMPEPSEVVSVSLLNRGIESYAFSKAPQPGMDYTKPLTILKHAGAGPMLAVASGRTGSAGEYEKLRRHALALYGSFRQYVVPELGDEKREKFDRFQAVARPFLWAVDDATRESLLPAINAGQSLFVVDTGMMITKLWEGQLVEIPVPAPAPALALELKDATKFKEAVRAYVRASEELMNSSGTLKKVALGGTEEEFSVPSPAVTPMDGGKLYAYTPSTWVDEAIQPNLAVTDDLAVFSLSPEQTKRMCEEGDLPQNDVVATGLPSGCVVQFRTGPLIECAGAWVKYLMEEKVAAVEMDDPEAATRLRERMELIRNHLGEALKSLGAFRGITSRTYRDGEYVVTHSWAEFRDG